MLLKIARFIAKIVIRIITDITVIGLENLPPKGTPAVAASNHIGKLDAITAMIYTNRDDIILMIAEKYRKSAILRIIARNVDAIWLNRFETDFRALRQVQKRIQAGGILAVAPEGTRSRTGQMQEAKLGTAYLAARSKAIIVPMSIVGTEDHVVVAAWRRLRRPKITIRLGTPFTLPPLPRKERDEYLKAQTDEIMCRIATLLPKKYHGVYAEHPRLQELLSEEEKVGIM